MLHLTFIFLENYILNMVVIIIAWRRHSKKFILLLHLRTGKKTDGRKITLTMKIHFAKETLRICREKSGWRYNDYGVQLVT